MLSDEKFNEVGAELGITEIISPLQELPEGYQWEINWDLKYDSLHLRLMKTTVMGTKKLFSTKFTRKTDSVNSCCVELKASQREVSVLMAETVDRSKKLWREYQEKDPTLIATKAAELAKLLGVKVEVV